MLITVVNPNTTRAMTEVIARCARVVAGPATRVLAATPAMGPASIESHYDEALSVPGVLAEIAAAEAAGSEGHVVACFGDPGVDAARELASGPVVGIAEAAMRTAAMLGRSFSVVTTLARTTGRAWDLAERYGVARACLGVHACGLEVLDLESPSAAAVVLGACRDALHRDGSDAVVLGCAGMAPLAPGLTRALGAPVVDGVAAATLHVQSLVTMGLRTSARGEFATPPPKAYTGLLEPFALAARQEALVE